MTSSLVTYLNKIARLIDRVSLVMGFLAGLWVVVMTFALGYEVVARRIFNAPTIWVVDFTEIGMVVMAYLGVAYTTQIDGHVAMDAVYTRLSPKSQSRVIIFVDLVMVAFAGTILWLGWGDAVDYVRRWPLTTAATLPIAPAVILIPIGVALLLLQTLVMLGRHSAKMLRSQETPEPCATE